jgi:hypothetical protein
VRPVPRRAVVLHAHPGEGGWEGGREGRKEEEEREEGGNRNQ